MSQSRPLYVWAAIVITALVCMSAAVVMSTDCPDEADRHDESRL
jgi:hypothetical protein